MNVLKAFIHFRKPNEKRLFHKASDLCHHYQNNIHRRKSTVPYDAAESAGEIMQNILWSVNKMPSGDEKVSELKSLINVVKKTIKRDLKQ